MGAVIARKAIPWTFLAFLLLLALQAGVTWLWLDARNDRAAAGATIAQGTRTGEAAIGETQYLGEATDQGRKVEVGIQQARAEAQQSYREAVNHDPDAAVFDATPVPDSLRAIARQRAAARLGSGSPEARAGADARAPGEADRGP